MPTLTAMPVALPQGTEQVCDQDFELDIRVSTPKVALPQFIRPSDGCSNTCHCSDTCGGSCACSLIVFTCISCTCYGFGC